MKNLILLILCSFLDWSWCRAGEKYINHSVVFIIHEDYPYEFYDGNIKKLAHKVAFEKAKEFAKECKKCEVFIFRQKAQKTRACLWPANSETAYFYHHGKLKQKEKFPRILYEADFQIEAEFYRKYSDKNDRKTRILAYFGHQVPEVPIEGYSISLQRTFSVRELEGGLKRFANASKKAKPFDAVILSAGFGGNPSTIAAISPYANYIIASVKDLSFVNFDFSPFADLYLSSKSKIEQFLQYFLNTSFEYLKRVSPAEISIALYETKKTMPFLQKLLVPYKLGLDELWQNFSSRNIFYGDCSRYWNYGLEEARVGVQHLFQPSVYAPIKAHSPWSCLTRIEAELPTS